MVELVLIFLSPIACGEAPDADVGRTASTATALDVDVTTPASDIGIDDAIFRRVDTQPLIVCPPDTPFMCRSQNAAGWSCSEVACAPSCEKIGCPGGWQCLDCGAGPECAPPDHSCK